MKRPDSFISIDIETTGLDPNLHEIIELGAVRVEAGEFADEFSSLVKPSVPIPEFITGLTGITDEAVRDAPQLDEVLPEFKVFCRGSILLGQNVGFDLSFLRRRGGYGAFGPAIDNVEFARIILPQLHAYNLDSLIEFFALEPESRHRALDDAKITAIVYLKLLAMLKVMPPDFATEMHQIAQRTGSIVADVFEAHIKERLSIIPGGSASVGPAPSAVPARDNLYGDFTVMPEPPPAETGRIDTARVAAHLAQGGSLSNLLPSYEERSGQLELAKTIAGAFNDAEIMLAEAGTGIGKSIAYLVPSLIWAENARERVVVSTNTKNLQEQLFYKDIPLLGEALGFKFRAVMLKGRGNYLCRNRWQRVRGNADRYLSTREKTMLLPVAAWLNSTVTGDLSETGFFNQVVESGLLEKINSDSPFCVGAHCPHREVCFVNRIRRAAQQAHLIVVNHSLVFSDMAAGGGVLGSYTRLVFDEAHNIEKVALRFLGVTMSAYRIRRMLNRLYVAGEKPYGLLVRLGDWCQEMARMLPESAGNRAIIDQAVTAVDAFWTATPHLFDRLTELVREAVDHDRAGHEGKLRYYEQSTVFRDAAPLLESFESTGQALYEALGEVVLLVSEASTGHLAEREELMVELEELRGEIEAVLGDLVFLAEGGGRNVFWFEFPGSGGRGSLRIMSAPLDIAEKLTYGLFDHLETVILTSATLTVARDFSYIRGRLGIDLDTRERVIEFIAKSPFDYRRQAAVMVPSFLPSPKAPEFIAGTNDVLFQLATGVGRGMLALFTSRSHLNQSYHELKDRLTRHGVTLLAQGIDGSRTQLLRRFQEETRSVLFGTDSFWEGIDVPGHALEIVVINRLPFAVPTDPVVQAQAEEVERAGNNPFMKYTVPEAAIKLRQGAGRLIRHRNDRGVVVVLDTRVAITRYGSLFMRSLPGTELRAETPELMIERVRNWFGDTDEQS